MISANAARCATIRLLPLVTMTMPCTLTVPKAPSLLEQYIDKPAPKLGGPPMETQKSDGE